MIDLSAITLGLISFGVMMVGLVWYFSTIPKMKVPKNPILLQFFMLVALVIGIYAIWKSLGGGTWHVLGAIVPSVFAITMAAFILWVLTMRKTPVGDIKVKVGDSILPFEVKTWEGKEFSSKELLGNRTLFKFFRGGWCPYCSAELRMFNKMEKELGKYKVKVVALSKDTVAEAKIHQERDSLRINLLSDPSLEVIRQYGVEHHKALGSSTANLTIFGIPITFDFAFKAMAIPTSMLVDEKGIIQWIDQAEDYRIRSAKKRVMGEIERVFGSL